jgi:hypothetical protein
MTLATLEGSLRRLVRDSGFWWAKPQTVFSDGGSTRLTWIRGLHELELYAYAPFSGGHFEVEFTKVTGDGTPDGVADSESGVIEDLSSEFLNLWEWLNE